ncbi:aldo/keto reductase [Desulfogranum mediterraneum]|uniref:aldo/keto reductase n=1 Tax=Desulfogranum mediterraneum TaxID=160661 RepID=UPI0004231727|nr:aldo/keto reductase [Desulfogranum mediterraneum]
MKSYSLSENSSIPALGLGTWKSAQGEVCQAVRTALELGYRHIDCAPAYENEAEIGRALEEGLGAGLCTREELWVTSKLWNNAHGADRVGAALKATLNDLRLDYLDLYLIHWPVVFSRGVFFPRRGEDLIALSVTPIRETWAALEACRQQGLVRHIGVCNFSIKKLEELAQTAVTAPAVNQIELHPLLQQPGMLRYCRAKGIVLTAYSPLGSGDRPAGLKKPEEPSLLGHPVIGEIARKHQASPAQVLLSWGMARETVVIPKSVNPQRLKENLAAAELLLDQDDLARIGVLDQHHRLVDGSFWQAPGSPYTLANLWDEEWDRQWHEQRRGD